MFVKVNFGFKWILGILGYCTLNGRFWSEIDYLGKYLPRELHFTFFLVPTSFLFEFLWKIRFFQSLTTGISFFQIKSSNQEAMTLETNMLSKTQSLELELVLQKQMIQRLLIFLTRVKAVNNSKSLKNKIRKSACCF